jgi:aminoglycoside N3'-acetyltransferase
MHTSGEHADGRALTRADIEAGLRRLGLDTGAIVEVHSSLSSLGYVDGGAAAVVDALMRIVGPEGALVMSAYPVTAPLPLSESDRARGIIAKVRRLWDDPDTPTGMGAIADEFRRRSGTVLGVGGHRVCAWGRDATDLSRGYQALIERDGVVLLLGADIHRCSAMHVAEEEAPLPDEITALFEAPADIEQDYPPQYWYVQYGDTPEDGWAKIQAEADRRGLIRRAHIGRAECLLFKAGPVVALYAEALRTDPYALFGVPKGQTLLPAHTPTCGDGVLS